MRVVMKVENGSARADRVIQMGVAAAAADKGTGAGAGARRD